VETPAKTQGYWGTLHTTATSPSTPPARVYLGVVDERGLTLRRFTAVPHTSLAASLTAYNTFRPFVSTVKNGVATVRYLGSGRGPNTYGLNADVPLRLHDEEYFNEKLPVGAVVGIDIVTTGSPASVRIHLQAGVIHHGR
jgi:hypothetical protein